MRMPGFNAEAALYHTRRQYRRVGTLDQTNNALRLAFTWGGQFAISVLPYITISWEPDLTGHGTLTVEGHNFTPASQIRIRTFDLPGHLPRNQTDTTTTDFASGCNGYMCYINYGGDFKAQLHGYPCDNNYSTAVEVLNMQTGDKLDETITTPCQSRSRS